MSMARARPYDLWCLRKQLTGTTLNGEIESIGDALRPLAVHLNGLAKPPSRKLALDGFLVGRPDRDDLVDPLSAVDPSAAPPAIEEPDDGPITGAELLAGIPGDPWHWEGFIGQANLTGLAAAEGTGKTRFMLDLARRIWLADAWPDGQAATFPAGTTTLWVCADGNQDEVAREADAMGCLGAILFNGSREDPYGFVDLDDPATNARLEANIVARHPGLVIVDTLTNATRKDLCNQAEVTRVMAPLKVLTQRHRVSITMGMHLNREGDILGRRLRGWCRTILKLECPDGNQPARLALAVFKTQAKRPASLGVTMHDRGNDYSAEVPAAPVPSKGGRPDTVAQKVRDHVVKALSASNDQPYGKMIESIVAAGISSKTVAFNVIRAMAEEGVLVIDDSGKPQILHLVNRTPEEADDD